MTYKYDWTDSLRKVLGAQQWQCVINVACIKNHLIPIKLLNNCLYSLGFIVGDTSDNILPEDIKWNKCIYFEIVQYSINFKYNTFLTNLFVLNKHNKHKTQVMMIYIQYNKYV